MLFIGENLQFLGEDLALKLLLVVELRGSRRMGTWVLYTWI